MHRPRVLENWARVSGTSRNDLEIQQDMVHVLTSEEELSRQDMKRWILRECDVADYKYWMPHLVVPGAVVRVYYTWVGKTPSPGYTIVLVVGGGLAQIHKWSGDKLIEAVNAKVGDKNGAGPSVEESLQISNYMSSYAKKDSAAMTVNGMGVKKINRAE